jgi:Peptidase family S41/Tricorn protease C1 domain
MMPYKPYKFPHFCICLLMAAMVLLTACRKENDQLTNLKSPSMVFKETWTVLDQRYALFSVKEINWKRIYDKYIERISDSMTEQDLFHTIGEMLLELKDGHVALLAPFDTVVYDRFYRDFPRNFNYANVERNYLKNEYKKVGPVIYTVQDQVGYLYYSSFGNDISEQDLQTIFTELRQVKGLIVDVRNNTGGSTVNAALLAKYLVPEKTLVKYEVAKKGKEHNNFFDPQPYYIMPGNLIFSKPVVLLTNRACFSACNDFIAYVAELPNVQIVGDQSGGGGSIPANYVLGNGWKIQFSSTITLSSYLAPLENGIIPDFSVGISAEDEANGKDPILEKAFQIIY